MTDFFDLKKAFDVIFSHPIAFHAVLGKLSGSATTGLMLSQACFWSGNPSTEKRDGWFYKTQEEWESETCLTRREQETARRQLRGKGYLEEKRQDVPAKLWFRVKYEKIWADLCQTSLRETDTLDWRKAPNKNGGNVQSLSLTENTSKNTTESKEAVAALPVWVPRQEWGEFVEMRKKIRAPLTEAAKTRTLNDLWNLSQAGQDVGAVLAQSVQRSWRGVFEVKNGNGQTGPQTFAEMGTRHSQAAIRRMASNPSALADDIQRALPPGTD